MKKFFEILAVRRSIVCVSIFVCVDLASVVPTATAAQLKAARVTRIIKDVKLLPGQAAPRPAVENDDVKPGTAVRTGTDSRTELTFADLTITRLGANTIFSFNEGTREIGLGNGAMLVEVPRGGAEVKIITAAVSAGVTGGTALFESNKGMPKKLLMLEGIGRFYRTGHPEEATIVHGGEMVMMTLDGQITRPTKFNAGLVYKTSKLITSFPKLANADLIMEVIDAQQADFASSPSGGSGGAGGDLDKRDIAIEASPPPVTTTSSAKFGSPPVITTPNPYHITGGTAISTDPKITTNGITDSGKIYRGPGEDGPFLDWLGATPTAFDNASGEPDPKSAVPIACFLFSGLQFDGDPIISTGNGGNSSLGLGSLGGITFSATGTVYQFSGLARVGIIALNGSIDTTGVAFANFGRLFLEARGAGSDLTLRSPISNLVNADLVAERDVQVSAPVTVSDEFDSFAGNNFVASSRVQANHVKVESLGSITVTSSAQILGLLNSTGDSGQVTLLASASDGQVNVGGQVQADQGTVDIETSGIAGTITLDTATLHGDLIKIGALGTNGTLNIGPGNLLNADTEIELYAGGSNGTINFLANVTLTAPTNTLAANTINIAQNVVVTINAAGATAADVFTNNPNYFGFGGNGNAATSGTFGGAGAKNPRPLDQAPPFHH
jgi:hypothetical protein